MTLHRVVIKRKSDDEVIRAFEPDSFHMCEMVKNGVDINLNKEEFYSIITTVEEGEPVRDFLPKVGYPVYDLRRRKFGICIYKDEDQCLAHIEGDQKPRFITQDNPDYEYPKFYMDDEVQYQNEEGYFIKHAHYHVPKDVWEYTIAKLGMEGFDRITVTQDELIMVNPKIKDEE